MKVKDLIEQLIGFEDFEVEANTSKIDDSEWGLTVETFDVDGVSDIAYSDKKIVLSLGESK